jgi:hypothetical protein
MVFHLILLKMDMLSESESESENEQQDDAEEIIYCDSCPSICHESCLNIRHVPLIYGTFLLIFIFWFSI